MTACAAQVGFCRCQRTGPHTTHRCGCGTEWSRDAAGVRISPQPTQALPESAS